MFESALLAIEVVSEPDSAGLFYFGFSSQAPLRRSSDRELCGNPLDFWGFGQETVCTHGEASHGLPHF